MPDTKTDKVEKQEPDRNPLVVAAETEAMTLAGRLQNKRKERDAVQTKIKKAIADASIERLRLGNEIRDLVPQVTQAERAAANLRKIYEPSDG